MRTIVRPGLAQGKRKNVSPAIPARRVETSAQKNKKARKLVALARYFKRWLALDYAQGTHFTKVARTDGAEENGGQLGR
jgi:hypothetical protein